MKINFIFIWNDVLEVNEPAVVELFCHNISPRMLPHPTKFVSPSTGIDTTTSGTFLQIGASSNILAMAPDPAGIATGEVSVTVRITATVTQQSTVRNPSGFYVWHGVTACLS